MFDPPVHTHKTVVMQRILDAASRGYCYHTSGTLPLHKAGNLAGKFAEHYQVHHNANQRAYAKRLGRASTRLFLYQRSNQDLMWWLLATHGSGQVHQLEHLDHLLDQRRRLRLEDDYEVVRVTRRREHGGGTVWTWRMTHICYAQWQERVNQVCRGNDALKATQMLGSLYRTPGFSGVRRQVGKLTALARRKWRRYHGDLSQFQLPPKLPYLERLPDTTVALSVLQQVNHLHMPT
ncbi:hypothetical protein [Sedimenticola selenatireducens]|uniref:Uncharacterized protein n=1 Tax=Sedimenticola selenatireducens TaxID=191960 RepID=A0A557S6P6_9GAMM|nr:hypothetical protein [Sedimenticola selenatireducens]TVO73027.1 hypothetical protein FHP88_12330 [Sedimenticola selenatireducens]TVT63213.1 MAG: hypothetical protein FHK78_12265 [Sedimenticola selenatireducens]